MKLFSTLFLMLFAAVAFAQSDTTAQRLADLKILYEHKKISQEKYQELTKQLLQSQQSPNPASSEAQLDAGTNRRGEEYCMLIGTGKLFSISVTIEVDFGNTNKQNVSGRLSQFNNMIDALNFMSSKGWELASSYVVNGSTSSAYHYLLKRRASGQ